MKTHSLISLLISFICCTLASGCEDSDPEKFLMESTGILSEAPERPVSPQPGNGTQYYVSVDNGSDTNPGTEQQPFKTIMKAATTATPGDIINIMNGTYSTERGSIINLKEQHSGTPGNYITYRAMAGHKPKIYAYGEVWNTVDINASYIIIDGIEMEGGNAHITYEEAYAAYEASIAGSSPQGVYNTNGINIGGSGKNSLLPKHVVVRNCEIHDFPGGGLSAIQTDYITFENNKIYNNAWYMMYAGSGISILCPYNSDLSTGYKNIIRNNVCYNNHTKIPWINENRLSDGNGIIIDININPYEGGVVEDSTPYSGRTLVENNVCINNGGSGIHAYKASHVDIINNTAYHNGWQVNYADIFSNTGTDVYILNNIMYAREGGQCNANNNNTDVIYDFNIYYNGEVAIKGTNDLIADPQFVNLSIDGSTADLKLKNTSPAVDSGIEYRTPDTDILNNPRPQGAGIDRGAYECF